MRRLSGRVAIGRSAEGRDVRVFFLSPLLDASLATQLLHRSLPGARQERLRVARRGVGGRRVGAPRGCESLGGHVDAKGRGEARARIERLGRPRGVRLIRRARRDGAGRETATIVDRRAGGDSELEARDRETRRTCLRARRTRLRDCRRTRTGRARHVQEGRMGKLNSRPFRRFEKPRERFRCKNETVCTSRNRRDRYAPQTRTT